MEYKKSFLIQRIEKAQRPLIAYSGDTDSTYLLFMANSLLPGRTQGIFLNSALISKTERQSAQRTAKKHKLPVVWLNIDPLREDQIAHNVTERCYYYKKFLFTEILSYAEQKGYTEIWDGSNDDEGDCHRLGQRALQELGILSPLAEAKLSKADIRQLAKWEALVNANKPAAPCLLSRFPYNLQEPITEASLQIVAKGEEILSHTLLDAFRLRVDGPQTQTARIETSAWDMERILDKRDALTAEMKSLGFSYITLDLTPFSRSAYDHVKWSK